MTKKKKTKSTLPPMRPPATTIAEFPAPPPPGSRTPSKPPKRGSLRAPPPAPPRDPIEIVREAIGELDLLGSAQIAARVCGEALALGLGARAVVVHATDTRARKIRVVAASGPSAAALAGKASAIDDDVIAATVTEMAGPMTLAIDPSVGLPSRAPERLKIIGVERTVLAMPAIVKGRVVAIIEVADPREAIAREAVEAATRYAATELGAFLESRTKR